MTKPRPRETRGVRAKGTVMNGTAPAPEGAGSPLGVAPTGNGAARVALYCRVSTDEQEEKETIKTQLDFLRRLADLHGWPVAGVYLDDGVSGKVPLGERPEGMRLLGDAVAGRFGTVVFYKIARLGRRLDVLLDAQARLDALGVAIRSGTEPLDTSDAIGRCVFQILGSIAELDHATIVENTSRGRQRTARAGRYPGGPVPIGLDLDDGGNYVPSARPVPHLGCTEAEMMRGIFERIAARQSTACAEANRLRALGVPREQRYGLSARRLKTGLPPAAITNPDGWTDGSLRKALKNPVYMGEGRYRSKHGEVPFPAVPLVPPAVWHAVQAALLDNRRLSTKNAKVAYPLRGLIRCENCGSAYVGVTLAQGRRYRCNGQSGDRGKRLPEGRCFGKLIDADWLEAAVWDRCAAYVRDPDAALDDARRRARERLAGTPGLAARRRALAAELAGKDGERERVLVAFRKGAITEAEFDAQVAAVAAERAALRAELDRLREGEDLASAHEARLATNAALLARLQGELDAIEAADDPVRKGRFMAELVREVAVRSERLGPRRIAARVRVRLALEEEGMQAEVTTSSPGHNYVLVTLDLAA